MSKQTWSAIKFTLWLTGALTGLSLRLRLIDFDTCNIILAVWLPLIVAVYFLSKERCVPHKFRPLTASEIPEHVRAGWDRLTEDYVLLGYRPAGDFELQSWPTRWFARTFLSDNPNTQGTICVTDDEVIPDFMTYFDDGRVIESAVHPTLGTRCRSDEDLWCVTQNGGNLFDLHHSHQKVIKAYLDETGGQTIDVTPDRFAELGRYAQRLMWFEWLGKRRHQGRPMRPQRVENEKIVSLEEFREPAHV